AVDRLSLRQRRGLFAQGLRVRHADSGRAREKPGRKRLDQKAPPRVINILIPLHWFAFIRVSLILQRIGVKDARIFCTLLENPSPVASPVASATPLGEPAAAEFHSTSPSSGASPMLRALTSKAPW